MTDPALPPAVPVPADRLAQIAADDQPFDPFDAIQLRVRLGEVEAELAAAHRERDEARRELSGTERGARVLAAEVSSTRTERDAALAQLAKVRSEIVSEVLADLVALADTADDIGPGDNWRTGIRAAQIILAAAGGHPGDTP
jgi:hypothetical protein